MKRVTLGLLAIALATPAAAASRTADLLNIIGIGGHISNYVDNSKTLSDAKYLGITKWRDLVAPDWSKYYGVYSSLYNSGISFIGTPNGTLPPINESIAQNINGAQTIAGFGPGALYALEGPNEPGNFTYNNVTSTHTWVPVAQFQRDYYRAIKTNSILHAIPVWTATLIGLEPDNSGLQFLTIPTPTPAGVLMPGGTVFADVMNIHGYPMWVTRSAQSVDPTGGNTFEIQLLADFMKTWKGGFLGYSAAQVTTFPRVITEFGYSSNHAFAGVDALDEPTQGRNILSGIMNAFDIDFKSICIYTFYDLGDGFGLFNGPGAPKLAAIYLHNFTALLSDTGATAKTFAPAPLAFSVAGLPSTARYRIFQKSNGTFAIVMWNNVTNWDFWASRPIAVPAVSVRLNFPQQHRVVSVYDPTTPGVFVSSTWNTNTATMTLGDHPIVIGVVP